MLEKNFGYLGTTFQQTLIKSIIENKKYGQQIIGVLESSYFDNQSFKFIVQNIKEYFEQYNRIPDYDSILTKLKIESGSESQAKVHFDTIETIRNSEQQTEYVEDEALNFCKQQNLKKELKKVEGIVSNGDFQNYKTIEDIIQKALQVGLPDQDAINVFRNIEDTLKEDSREAIPTGIDGIDNLLRGGLGRGELGVILAPTGIGKSTLITKFANTAFNMGLHVYQLFFEDNVDNIKKKHFTIWSGIPSQDQFDRRDEVIPKVQEAETRSTGSLHLKKIPSDSVTISEIKSVLRKHLSEGHKIDLLLIDYVDCISPEKTNYNEEWKGDGAIMRGIEAMCAEFDIAIWTATQGNRGSISSELVTTDQMGGSIKKAQIGHVVISVAKTLEQKEHNLATMALLKSRIGKDGVTFPNCRFNNEYLDINTDSQNTLLGHQEEKVRNNQDRVRQAFLSRQELLNRQ